MKFIAYLLCLLCTQHVWGERETIIMGRSMVVRLVAIRLQIERIHEHLLPSKVTWIEPKPDQDVDEEYELRLFRFTTIRNTKEIIEAMKDLGYRPARIEEYYPFSLRLQPNAKEKIIVLGSKVMAVGKSPAAFIFCNNDAGDPIRKFIHWDLLWFDTKENWFLGVKITED